MSWSASGYSFRQPIDDLQDPDGLQSQMRQFLEHIRIKGYSQQTLYGYERYLRDFIVWGQGLGVVRTSDLTLPIITRYQSHLGQWITRKGTPLAKLSQLGKLIPLRAFLRWLARTLPELRSVLAEMEMPKITRRIPNHICSAADIDRVLKLPDATSLLGLRDRAILELLYSTGMRRMELIGLAIDDIDFGRASVIIRHGKGDRARLIPVGHTALDSINDYLTKSRQHLLKHPTDRLFVTRGGQAISSSWLSGLVGNYIAKAKTGKKGACHLLRHSMATLMLENGADIRFIQEILGHAQLSTTQIYTHVSVALLHRIHAATHPGERSANRHKAIAERVARRQEGVSRSATRPSANPIYTEILGLIRTLPSDAGWPDVLALIEQKVASEHALSR